ncbi:hypothetical protein IBX35_05675 [Candidatus Bathyarchaeota archaeon]|nr:hypothetical protein [Candidatus Bathyarchaeota archaeon]
MKRKLFVRLGFLKPKPEEIRLLLAEKFYEPYIVVGGKYLLDYCRDCIFTLKVDPKAQEITILGQTFKPEPRNDASGRPCKVIRLKGEGSFHYEDEGYFILDRIGREVPPERLSFAPLKEQTIEKIDANIKSEDVKISEEEAVKFLGSRIAKRPSDAKVIVDEVLEVSDHILVYCPTYKLAFQNLRTGEEAILEIDGITGRIISCRKDRHTF